MDLRKLDLFLAVVDHGGFTRAAEARFVSQPSVSQAVRELEAELGTALFHRVGRRVTLTAAGEALVPPARQALRDVENARAAVAVVVGLEGGVLDLCSLPTLAVDPLAPLVGAFRTAHPSVGVTLADPDDAREVESLVASAACEVGLTVEAPVDPGLRAHRLTEQDLVAVYPRGAAVGRSTTFSELTRFPLVTGLPGTSTRRQLDDACAAAGVTPDIAVVTAQREAIVPLVVAGAGATMLPAPLAQNARALGATVVPFRRRVRRPVLLLHRRSPRSPAADAFLAVAGVDVAA
jgi:LysR family transcriptional regulator, carnitine catabolism transcriptional activator